MKKLFLQLLKKKKFKNFLQWFAIGLFVIVMWWVASFYRNSLICKSIQVNIADTNNRFLHQNDIILEIKKHQDILGEPIGNIDIENLKQIVLNYPAVKEAEVYKTLSELTITVHTKIPIVRIISNDGSGFYIDEDAKYMGLSKYYSARVLVINGNIHTDTLQLDKLKLLEFNDSKLGFLAEIYELSKYIYEHPFWKSQIEQIYVKNNFELELIPKVGAHIIDFGTVNNYEKKLRKLYAVYKEGFNRVGWNKYTVISLKYDGQVVCRLR